MLTDDGDAPANSETLPFWVTPFISNGYIITFVNINVNKCIVSILNIIAISNIIRASKNMRYYKLISKVKTKFTVIGQLIGN